MKNKIFALLFILSACNSNPYPEEGGEIVNGRQPVKKPVAPAYTIDVNSTIKFREGVKGTHKIKFSVPTKDPMVSFKGLPDNFKYDEVEGKLIWTPGYNDANDPNDPLVKVTRRTIEIWLRSKSDSNTAIKKEVVVEVSDTPRKFELTTNLRSTTVDEGEELNKSFEFLNEDFPDGPFIVFPKNLPQDMDIVAEGSKVTLKYTPTFDHVGIEDDCSYYSCDKEYDNGKFQVIAPDGRLLEIPFKLTVDDVRHAPEFVTPSEIRQGTDVSFVVSANDKNSEIKPVITTNWTPDAGQFTFEEIETKGALKQTHMKFTWRNVPEDMRGDYERITFKACVNDYRGQVSNCKDHRVEVHIEEKNHSAPMFDRTNWPLANIKYFGYGKKYSFDLDIVDGDDADLDLHEVKIYPEAMAQHIEYRWGTLYIDANITGMNQFKVVATSKYGIETTESFTFETLPESWSENLSFIGALRSNEVLLNKKLIVDMDVANPDFQKLDKRLLAERQTLILGTDIVNNSDKIEAVSNLAPNFKNVVVMSSSLEKLPGAIISEMSSLGVSIKGKFKDVMGGKLNNYFFVIGKDVDLKYPKRRVRLEGRLTSSSSNPVILSVSAESNCKSALSLGDDNSTTEYLVTVKCKRDNGGYLLINGFEFGDLKVIPDDAEIPQAWLSALMEK